MDSTLDSGYVATDEPDADWLAHVDGGAGRAGRALRETAGDGAAPWFAVHERVRAFAREEAARAYELGRLLLAVEREGVPRWFGHAGSAGRHLARQLTRSP